MGRMLHTQTCWQMEHQGTVGREGTGTGGPTKQGKAAQQTAGKACKQKHTSKGCNAVEDAVTFNSSIGARASAMSAAERTGAGPLWDPLALWYSLLEGAAHTPLPTPPALLLL